VTAGSGLPHHDFPCLGVLAVPSVVDLVDPVKRKSVTRIINRRPETLGARENPLEDRVACSEISEGPADRGGSRPRRPKTKRSLRLADTKTRCTPHMERRAIRLVALEPEGSHDIGGLTRARQRLDVSPSSTEAISSCPSP